ncbi:hypothetical protein M8542_08740 [Amycolatopsis sp. OK19-0408]|uniref:Secreted protein n=1 Tax=Amycolatopsis iheyensis TaxID=2945988 RepID=A0A9X2SHZ2_9PSEU|nr:hypothetical protein [Amycolatopsis iheyensis]MCR6482904.1 hypothetical protein [Amycolatopsis iheyensis]
MRLAMIVAALAIVVVPPAQADAGLGRSCLVVTRITTVRIQHPAAGTVYRIVPLKMCVRVVTPQFVPEPET